MNKSAPTMDEVWHTLPLGILRCHTGTYRHRVVFDCVALYNVLCRHAPPLRWRETAVVFILCWHALPTSHATHAVRGLRQVLLLLFVFSTHRFLLFCVGTHCQRVMRLMPCGGYDKSSYYYFVFSTHCFLLFVLARFANESCDSCRAGATTSPLIIILCSQHTAFYYLCWHALPTSHATHAVRGLRQVLLLLFCVLNTLLFIICVGTLCQRVMRLMPCGGYDKSSYYYLCLQHTAFYYLQVLLLLFCVCNTPLFYYFLHSCLPGM